MAEMPEESKNIPDSQGMPISTDAGPFGLLASDRPMLPGENKIPPQDDKGFKTTGERFYDRLQFAVGNVFILTATAVIAYISQYGQDKYGKVPNYLKKFQDTLNKKVYDSPTAPLRQQPGKSEIPSRIGGAVSSATVLGWGGILFSPTMHWLENHREGIATWANKRWGKQGEVEAGHNRLKDSPKQSWGDVIKGRLAAWGIVFSSFTAFDVTNALLKKDKTKPFLLDRYVGAFGKTVAGLTKSGKEATASGDPAALKSNKAFQFSTILALDLYATTAALFIWNFISRLSARSRKDKQDQKAAAAASQETQSTTEQDNTPKQKKSFAEREGGKPKDFYTRAAESPATSGPTV